MKKFIIITTSTAYSEYTVQANNLEEAQDKFYDGYATGGDVTDYADEEIINIEEAEQ